MVIGAADLAGRGQLGFGSQPPLYSIRTGGFPPGARRQQTLPRDRVLVGTVRNDSLRRLTLEAKDVRAVDEDGAALKGDATFIRGYVHPLYPPTRPPAGGLPESELERLGRRVRLEPGTHAVERGVAPGPGREAARADRIQRRLAASSPRAEPRPARIGGPDDQARPRHPFASGSSEPRRRSSPRSPRAPIRRTGSARSDSEHRTPFQRDRDRIVHSKAFRRLKHKTQVFIAPEGDHYRTRLTHTLEACGIARTVARALGLNEDLTEAIGLGHDLGHPPFGHIGEEVLDACVSERWGTRLPPQRALAAGGDARARSRA